MKVMKLSVAIAAAFGAAQSYAYNPADPATPTAFEFRIAGATATTNSLRDVIISKVCNPAQPIDQVVHLGTAHYNIACTDNTSGLRVLFRKNDGGSGTGTKPVDEQLAVDFVKADRDLKTGSSTGCVSPGVFSAQGVSYTRWTCGSASTNLEQVVPDFGVSDIEPEAFVGDLADPAVGDFTNATNMPVSSEAALPFGINATVNLYRALQATQFPQTSVCNPIALAGEDLTQPTIVSNVRSNVNVPNGIKDAYEAQASDSVAASATQKVRHNVGDTAACMPSMTTAEIQSLLGSKITNWNRWDNGDTNAATNLVTANSGFVWSAGTASTVRICRRTSGSGTHAITGIHFLKTGCGEGPRGPGEAMTSQGASPGPNNFGTQRVTGNVGSSDMDTCLTNVNNSTNGVSGSRWGIGYNSLERNSTLAQAFRFVKIDGQAPTLTNFLNSNYWHIGETTFQKRGTPGFVGAPANAAQADAIWTFLQTEFKTPATVGTVLNQNPIFYHPFGDSGWAARGTNPYPINLAAPIAPLEHTKSGQQNSCFGPIAPDGASPL